MFDPEVIVLIISNLIPDASQICLWVKHRNCSHVLVYCTEDVLVHLTSFHEASCLFEYIVINKVHNSFVCFIFGLFASLGRTPLLSGQVSILIDPEGAEIDCQHLPPT